MLNLVYINYPLYNQVTPLTSMSPFGHVGDSVGMEGGWKIEINVEGGKN